MTLALEEPVFQARKTYESSDRWGWMESHPSPGPGTLGQFPKRVLSYFAPFRKSFVNPDGGRVNHAARVNLLENGDWIAEDFGLHMALGDYSFDRRAPIRCEAIEWRIFVNEEPFKSLEDAMDWCEEQMRRSGVLKPEDK